MPDVDRGEPVVVREVEIRKGTVSGVRGATCTEQNGKSPSRPRERHSMKLDQRDLSDVRRGKDPNCMTRRRRAVKSG